jgi:hypothetical protein
MPSLRKVPQVMVKNDRDETTALFPFPIFYLFSGSIISLSFSFFSFFCFCFFYVTEGLWHDQTGDGGGALGFEWWKKEGW